MNPRVDDLLNQQTKWRDELVALRKIALACGLSEEVKWGQPCYTDQGRNIAIIHGFKDYCALLFMKGALLKDPPGILIQQTENVQSGRQIRFTALDQIAAKENLLKAYIQEAVEIEKAGLKVERRKTEDFEVAAEFQSRLDQDPELKKAFQALTPGRQRAYLLHFAGARQAKTREARIDKCRPQILAGKGLMD
jgi:uncharacterized protein YdeI (YjbR/CyaY-like superfamily)